LVTAHDVPANAAGPMPFKIGIDAQGEVYASHEGVLPGWCGN
jgi:hypothetical protein